MRSTLLLLFFLASLLSQAQIAGKYAFEASTLPSNARLTALGGSLISVVDDDIALAHQNPALINALMDGQLGINHNFHFSGISNGYVGYGKSFDSLGIHTHAAIQYLNYGQFDLTDNIGNIQGDFSGGEFAFILGVSKRLNERIYAGTNIKFLHSNLESYSSQGIGVDVGIHYKKPGSNYAWGFVLKNMGYQFSAFANEKKPLPFDFQIGYSRKLKHLPFRFSIIGQRLYKWDIRYDDQNAVAETDIFGNATEESGFSNSIDNFFRHLIINGEFLIGKAEQFRLRFGYNHLRRKELSVSSFRSLAGFSTGVGFNIKKIRIDYGLGFYHLAGATNHLSLRLDIDRMFNKV